MDFWKGNMENNWKKLGLVYPGHHAQLPVTEVLDDRIRVYYSTRNTEGKSLPMFMDIDLENPLHQLSPAKSLGLELGNPGSFDWSGIMPTKFIQKGYTKMLYYIGWSRRIDVPYHNNLGLAISEDDGQTWRKFSKGPVFNTSQDEPGYIGTAEILIDGDTWRMWYLSCQEWIEHQGTMEPIYDIKYAESSDGLRWTPSGNVHIPLSGKEGGISAASIFKNGDFYEMLFSVRDKINYRVDVNSSYRIKKAISSDLKNWVRADSIEVDVSENKWEDFMVCYPCVTVTPSNTFLFYNGNGFGKAGICVAKKIT